MITRYVFNIALLLLPYFGLNLVHAQSTPQWLIQSVKEAEIVVEGEIVEQKPYIDSTHQKNFTAHTVKIHHVFKGTLPNEGIYINTEGGCVDGTCQTVSHGVSIGQKERGIYFLKVRKATSDVQKTTYYQLVGGDRIKKWEGSGEMEGYYQNKIAKFSSWRKLREDIGDLCGSKIKLPRLEKFQLSNSDETQFCVKIGNAKPVFGEKKVEFDVYAKSNIQGVEFEGVDLVFHYPPELLGYSIISDNKVVVEAKAISENPIYAFTLADKSTSSFSVKIDASCLASSERYALSNEYEKLAHLVIEVEEWGSLGNISLEDFSIEGDAKYYQQETGCYEFGYLCVESGVVPLEVCEITGQSAAPFGAGVRDLITGEQQTITFAGNGFGNGLFGKIEVPNADDGGASDLTIYSALFSPYIKSWTDTEIEVYLSSKVAVTGAFPPMGSGDWKIYPADLLGCIEKVDIDYALLNSSHLATEDKMISLAKDKAKVPSGAVEWYIHEPSLPVGVTLANIESVAQQAFCDWETASSIEFKYLGTTTAISNSDERITIYFGVPASPGSAAETNIAFSPDDCDSDLFFTGRIRDNNILFNSALSWYIDLSSSPGINQYDFYSVLMHEIGHAIGLEHAMDTDLTNGTADSRLMYYSLNNSQVKRNIDAKSLRGADDLADRTEVSLIAGLPDCYGTDSYGFSRVVDGCATKTDDIRELLTVNLLNNLIEGGDNLWLISNQRIECEIHIYDLLGRRIGAKLLVLDSDWTSILINEMTAGYYMLTVVSSGQQKSFPFLVK